MPPSFLPFDRDAEIPDRVFEDLQTRRIFSERAVGIMKYPCKPETLRRRQQLFRLLLSGEFYERFERFHASLIELRRLDERFRECGRYSRGVDSFAVESRGMGSSGVESYGADSFGSESASRGLIAARLVEKYLSVKAELFELCRIDMSGDRKLPDDEPSGGTWCDRLLEWWSGERSDSADESLREKLDACRSAIERVKGFGLSLQGKSWIVPLPDGETYSGQLCRIAESLGFKLTPRKIRETALEPALDDALCRLYRGEISRLNELALLCSDNVSADTVTQSGRTYSYADGAEQSDMAHNNSSSVAQGGRINNYADGAAQRCEDRTSVSLREAIDVLVGYIDETAFCLEVARFVRSAAEKGLEYCFAQISTEREYIADSLYDVTLLTQNIANIVPNDVYFDESERFYFLVGANGGGKTTYLRAIGQNLLLFLCGAPVFASSASIYPFRHLEVVFAGAYDGGVIRGHLSEILPDSFLLLNEIYSSLDEESGLAYALDFAARLDGAGGFGLFVTHFYGVRQSGLPLLETLTVDKAASGKAASDRDASGNASSGNAAFDRAAFDNAASDRVRTYKIVRATGSASSHALDILKKYRLDPESLRVRRAAIRQKEGGNE